MSSTTMSGRRGATTAVLVVAGGALSLATWLGGERGLAVGLLVFYAICATLAYVWSGRDGDAAAILRFGGDERQRSLDKDASHIAGLVMVTVAIVGSIASAALNHGDIGVYGLFAAVGGLSYIVALGWLRRRA
jgi:hypothetical protein